MELQYQIIYISLILTIASLGVGTVVYIVLEVMQTRQYIELILQLMAISAGVMIIGISLFTGKTVPELVTIQLLNADALSLVVLIYGYMLPILFGLCTGLYLIKWFTVRSSQSFRILCFLNASVVTFSFISIAMVYDELTLQKEMNTTISSLENLQSNINTIQLQLRSERERIDKVLNSEKKVAELTLEKLHASIDTMMDAIEEGNRDAFELHKFYNSVKKYYDEFVSTKNQVISIPQSKTTISLAPNLSTPKFANQISTGQKDNAMSNLKYNIDMAISSLSERKKIQFTRILVPNLNFLLSVFIYIILMYDPKKKKRIEAKSKRIVEDFSI